MNPLTPAEEKLMWIRILEWAGVALNDYTAKHIRIGDIKMWNKIRKEQDN